MTQESGLENKLRIMLSGHEPFKGNMRHVDQEAVNIVRDIVKMETGRNHIRVGFLGFGEGNKQKVYETSGPFTSWIKNVYDMPESFFETLGTEFAEYYGSLDGVASVDAFKARLRCTVDNDDYEWNYNPERLREQFAMLGNVDLLYIGGGDMLLLEMFMEKFWEQLKPILHNTHLALYSAPAMILGSHWIRPVPIKKETIESEKKREEYRKRQSRRYGECEYIPRVIFDDKGIQRETGVVLRKNRLCILDEETLLAFQMHCKARPKEESFRAAWSQECPPDLMRAATAAVAQYNGSLVNPQLNNIHVVTLEGETGFVFESGRRLELPGHGMNGTFSIHNINDGSRVSMFKRGERVYTTPYLP